MFLIVIYDIDVESQRDLKLHKFLKKRLTWIQNSVFQGELTKSEYIIMKTDIQAMLKEIKIKDKNRKDSIIIFKNNYEWNKEVLGIEKNPITNFI